MTRAQGLQERSTDEELCGADIGLGKDHGPAHMLGSLEGERRWQGEKPWLLRAVFAVFFFSCYTLPGPDDVPALQPRRGSQKAQSGVNRVIQR